ncbi:MAG: FHA domain-containing protein [Pseudomonadota bacterium]
MKRWVRKLDHLAGELKRRRVIQVAGFYLVAAWGASQGVAEIFPLFGAPDWAIKAFVVTAFGATPGVIALAWMFDITPSGIKRDDGLAAPADRPASEPDEETTVLRATDTGSVVVAWRDSSGARKRVFTSDFTMGRGESCELRFHDPLISRRHARVALEDGQWTITDLGSKNGTLLSGRKVSSAPLPPHSELRLDESGPLLQLTVLPPGKHDEQETVIRYADPA